MTCPRLEALLYAVDLIQQERGFEVCGGLKREAKLEAASPAAEVPRVKAKPSSTPVPANPWDQQPGENDLWYARFLRYVALGPSLPRSVSLVARGRKNAYPIPAHWPIQAKQNTWKVRAEAFDAAAKADTSGQVTARFNALIGAMQASKLVNGEAEKLLGVTYQAPPPRGEDDDLDDQP